jgi:hypothetical protein
MPRFLVEIREVKLVVEAESYSDAAIKAATLWFGQGRPQAEPPSLMSMTVSGMVAGQTIQTRPVVVRWRWRFECEVVQES